MLIEIWIYITGSPRVEGDEEEDGADDLEHEFKYDDYEALTYAQNAGEISLEHRGSAELVVSSKLDPDLEIPLLTYGEEVLNYSYVQFFFLKL